MPIGCYKDEMGLAKRMLEEIWERGWESIGKSVCPDCLEDSPLRQLAAESLDGDECDYCGRVGEKVATDTDVVMTRIGESIHSEYRDPVHELPYDSGEGGYQGDWCHTYDLLDRLGEDIGCQEFVDDVVRAFGLRGWCQRDYFTLRADEALSFSWQRFAKVVKEEYLAAHVREVTLAASHPRVFGPNVRWLQGERVFRVPRDDPRGGIRCEPRTRSRVLNQNPLEGFKLEPAREF